MDKKYLISFLFLILLSVSFRSQNKTIPNSFIIKNNKSKLSEIFITESVLNANLETFRLQNERLVIDFSNGFKLELLSALELVNSGLYLDLGSYNNKFPVGYKFPLFTVLESGFLTAEVFTNSK